MRSGQAKLPLERRYPAGMPRARMKVGSPEWCYFTVDYARSCYRSYRTGVEEWEKILDEIETGKAYEVIPPEKPYGSLDALLKAEIGVDAKQSMKKFRLRKYGSNQHRKEEGGANITPSPPQRGSTDAAYLTARLERDHPEIAAQLKAGEFKSVRAAAVAAGIVRPIASFYTDNPADAARAILRAFTGDRLEAFKRALEGR